MVDNLPEQNRGNELIGGTPPHSIVIGSERFSTRLTDALRYSAKDFGAGFVSVFLGSLIMIPVTCSLVTTLVSSSPDAAQFANSITKMYQEATPAITLLSASWGTGAGLLLATSLGGLRWKGLLRS